MFNYKLEKIKPQEFYQLAQLYAAAYPSNYPYNENSFKNLIEFFKDIYDNVPEVSFYGLFDGQILAAAMTLMSLQQNIQGKTVNSLAMSGVSVGLQYKQQGLAKVLSISFQAIAAKNNCTICLLFPFDISYYYKRSFGFFSETYNWRFSPKALRAGKAGKVVEVTCNEQQWQQQVIDAFFAHVSKQHGEIYRNYQLWKWFWNQEGVRIFATLNDNMRVDGYVAVRSIVNNRTGENILQIVEWINCSLMAKESLREFLRRQSEQFEEITWECGERNIRYYLQKFKVNDNHNLLNWGHMQYSGNIANMARITDFEGAKAIVRNRQLACQQTIAVELAIYDSLLDKEWRGRFVEKEGCLFLADSESDCDADIYMDWADFSSWLLSVIDINSLYDSGKVKCNNEEVIRLLNKNYLYNEMPQLSTKF